jgi:hypothetical protein
VEALRDYIHDLERWLSSERVLHMDMIAKGGRILLDPRASTNHVNISQAGSYLMHSLLGGRIFGNSRAARWSKPRAMAQALTFPLVPVIRLRRMLRQLNSPAKRKRSKFWAALPWTLAGLSMHAIGEGIGYLAGAGNSMDRYMAFETRRIEHVCSADRPLLFLADDGVLVH